MLFYKSDRKRTLPMFLSIFPGILFMLYVFLTSGISFLRVPAVYTDVELTEFHDNSNIRFRPYAEVHFDEVSFTGLYLYRDDENVPTDLVMLGFFQDKYLLFYQKVKNTGSFPDDAQNVSYILRYPQAENAAQSKQIYDTFTGDVVTTYEFETEFIDSLFFPFVLEADRNGTLMSSIIFFSGAAASLFFTVVFIRGKRVKDVSDMYEGADTETDFENEDEDEMDI